MSEATEMVDLTESPIKKTATPKSSEKSSTGKKLKQLRLPFAPIQKNVTTDPSKDEDAAAKKRKLSEESAAVASTKKQVMDASDDDVVVVVEAAKSATIKENTESTSVAPLDAPAAAEKSAVPAEKVLPRGQKKATKKVEKRRSSTAAKKSPKASKVGTPAVAATDSDDVPKVSVNDSSSKVGVPPATPKMSGTSKNLLGKTPTSCSPVVIEEKKRKLKLAIAKATHKILELGNELDAAVKAQEFLQAQQLKESINNLEKERATMQAALDASDIEAIQDILTPKSVNTSVNSSVNSSLNQTTTNSTSSTPNGSPAIPKNRKRSKAPAPKIPSSPASHGTAPPLEGTPSSSSDATTPKVKKLTPKQVALRAEMEKRKEERERQREEARKAKEAEKQKKETERKEKELQKEQERLEREREKKAREEERERQRVERERQKEQEKREKEEKQKQRELEKEMKEQEKKLQEEMEKKKSEKLKEKFQNFFVKKSTDQEKSDDGPPKNTNNLTQFRVKKDMRLAPILRSEFTEKKKSAFDEIFRGEKSVNSNSHYLKELKSGAHSAQKTGRTWPPEALNACKKTSADSEVEIIEEDEEEDDTIGDDVVVATVVPEKAAASMPMIKTKIRAKLLQFHENQRPPYWGTWSKQTSYVGPRRPFGKDDHFFDYDYDSDDDWEEEEQGESLSDEEKDKEEEEDEEEKEEEAGDDDGFFVGHGVLGKDELHAGDDSDEGEFDAELEMKKQKLRAQEFEKEYKKKKTTKLKPRVYGPFWINDSGDTRPAIVIEQLLKILTPYRAVSLGPSSGIPTLLSVPVQSPTVGQQGSADGCETPSAGGVAASGAGGTAASKRWRSVPDEAIPDLIRLVHTNTNNKNFLAKEFVEYWKKSSSTTGPASGVEAETPNANSGVEISRAKVLAKIQEIAEYTKFAEAGPMLNKRCWIVKKEVLEKFSDIQPEIPNNWEYTLEVPTRVTNTPSVNDAAGASTSTNGVTEAKCDTPKTCDRPPSKTSGSAKSKTSLITKFTKVMTGEERQNQLTLVAAASPKPSAAAAVVMNPSTPSAAKKKIQPTLLSMSTAIHKQQQQKQQSFDEKSEGIKN